MPARSAPVAGATQRLFFALWPSASAVAALAEHAHELARRARGRPTASSQLHLTMAFLGDVPLSALPRVLRAGDNVRATSFRACFDEIGCWRSNGIGWLAPSDAASLDALHALSTALRASLINEGVAFDTKPFKPHLTLARKLQQPLPTQRITPICWSNAALTLVRSVLAASGPSYEIIAQWELGDVRDSDL